VKDFEQSGETLASRQRNFEVPIHYVRSTVEPQETFKRNFYSFDYKKVSINVLLACYYMHKLDLQLERPDHNCSLSFVGEPIYGLLAGDGKSISIYSISLSAGAIISLVSVV
jgi:hypothetical protein